MGYAADTYAKITREQYQDWKTRFYPKQQELMELATNGQLLRKQLKQINKNNNGENNRNTMDHVWDLCNGPACHYGRFMEWSSEGQKEWHSSIILRV